MEYNDVDSEGLIIPEVSSMKPGTPAIESFCYKTGGGRGKWLPLRPVLSGTGDQRITIKCFA